MMRFKRLKLSDRLDMINIFPPAVSEHTAYVNTTVMKTELSKSVVLIGHW